MGTKNTILNTALDLFFPVSCYCCRQPKHEALNPLGILCSECRAKISLNEWIFCPVCNKKLAHQNPPGSGENRSVCLNHPSGLKWLGVASNYNDKILKPLIWEYKYGLNESLAEVFSGIMFQYFEKISSQILLDKNNLAAQAGTVLSFIPLASKRLRWRGFNQAKLLAQGLAQKTGLVVVDSLERKAYSLPQMSLETKKQRFQNIKNSFGARNQKEICGKDIVLVDDVCATGATLIEAARTLRRAGAKNIYGLVLARKL